MKSNGYKSIPSNSDYIRNYEIDKPAAGYFWELSVKLALLVFLFPFSLLFLVIFYGFDGAARIVKELFKDALIFVFKLALVTLCPIFILVMIFHK